MIIRAVTTDDYSGPPEGEKAFVAGLCDRLAVEFSGRAALEDVERSREGSAVRYTIEAVAMAPGLPALEPASVSAMLHDRRMAARKQELESGPLFGREAADA